MGQVLSIDQADFPVPAGAASQENADWTLGPLIVGWAGNLFLCGIVVSWASSYWSRAKGDKKVVKCAVVVAVLFECLCAIANLWSLVDHGKDQDRTNDAISRLIGPDALSVTLGTVVAVAVQSFFGMRCVRALPRQWRAPFIIWTWGLIGASFGGALGITAIEFINKGATDVTRGASPDAYDNLYYLALVWLFCAAVVDVSISIVLIGRLWIKARAAKAEENNSETYQPLKSSVWGFMRLTFEAALATAVTSLIAGLTYVTLTKTTNVSYALSNLLPGLYACSLLWVLNSAHRLADEINLAQLNSIQLVWNLGPATSASTRAGAPLSGGAPDSEEAADQAARFEPAALAQVVHGGEGTWEVKRALASAKARQRLGEQAYTVSVRRRLSETPALAALPPAGAAPLCTSQPLRWGRGSIVSLFGGGSGSGSGCSGSEGQSPSQRGPGRGSIASLWTTGTATSKSGGGSVEAV